MNDLIDLILENPFFLIIIIGGIISMLRGRSGKSEEENNQPANNQKPKRAESPFERSRQTEQRRPSPPMRETVAEPVSTRSIEELREEQMLRFSGQTKPNERQQRADIPRIADSIGKEVVSKKSANDNNKTFKKDFNESLTRKGLVNSVIMAEVLGAPRARRSYQTVITKRRSI